MRGPAFFAYANNYLVDVKFGVPREQRRACERGERFKRTGFSLTDDWTGQPSGCQRFMAGRGIPQALELS
jgi:hypothetical protein